MSSDNFVNVTPVKGQNGQISWTLSYAGKKGTSSQDYPPIVLAKYDTNAKITFTIKDGDGITFAADPIWVAVAGPGNPVPSPSKAGVNDQIDSVKLHNSTQLVIVDKNKGDPVTLSYQLNFEGAPPLDPIIQNGGSGPPGIENYYYLIGGGLILALVAFLVVRKMRSNTPNV